MIDLSLAGVLLLGALTLAGFGVGYFLIARLAGGRSKKKKAAGKRLPAFAPVLAGLALAAGSFAVAVPLLQDAFPASAIGCPSRLFGAWEEKGSQVSFHEDGTLDWFEGDFTTVDGYTCWKSQGDLFLRVTGSYGTKAGSMYIAFSEDYKIDLLKGDTLRLVYSNTTITDSSLSEADEKLWVEFMNKLAAISELTRVK